MKEGIIARRYNSYLVFEIWFSPSSRDDLESSWRGLRFDDIKMEQKYYLGNVEFLIESSLYEEAWKGRLLIEVGKASKHHGSYTIPVH